MATTRTRRAGGFGTTLRGAIHGGALAGLFLGLADGIVASFRGGPRGALELAGCIATAVLVYGLVWITVALAATPVLHRFVRRGRLRDRAEAFAGLTLGLGLFFEIYWWTRPFVFFGRSSTSPERLAAAAVFLAIGLALGWAARLALARVSVRVHGFLSLAVVGIWLGGALFWWSEQRVVVESRRGAINERNADVPNVLLIVVDALRADTIGAYGDERARTPAIDRLAERGVLFENAYAQAPYTWTSFGSILTGKYPRRHGLMKMASGVAMVPQVTLPYHLKNAMRADGVALRDEDFAAATFMTGTLSHGSGLMRGFDTYFEALVGHELVHLDSAWSVFASNLLLSIFKNKLTQRFDNNLVATTCRDWLRANAHRRFAVMLHLYTTHTPYDPPERHREPYVDPGYGGPVSAFYAHHRAKIESGAYELTEADARQIRDLYYGGVTWADEMVASVIEELERQAVLDDTIVVITSDHGEELGDHGLWEHNWMYQTNLRIPLIVSYPPGLPEGERVTEIVESIDLVPTICDLMGIVPPGAGATDELERIDGESLLPLVRGEVDELRRFSFSENGRFLSIQDPERKLIAYDPPDATRSPTFDELLGASDAGVAPIRYYDLVADPDETRNLVLEREEEARELYEELVRWSASMPRPRHLVVRSHRDERALMEQLGYTEEGVGAGAPPSDEASEPR